MGPILKGPAFKDRADDGMAGYAERRDGAYQQQLRQYVGELGIRVVELDGITDGSELLSVYPHADVVTYPSAREGFGNQFLEAVYAKKPVAVWEYPVFRADIAPLGFEVISLGDRLEYDPHSGLAKIEAKIMDRVARQTLAILADQKRRKAMVEKNFAIGQKHFSYEQAARVWERYLLV